MKTPVFRHIIAFTAAILFLGVVEASAQFKEEAFTQSYNPAGDTLGTAKDSTDTLFSFREFFGGVSHKRDARIGTLFAGSSLFVGSYQIYNRDYWKLPLVYGTIGSGIGMGLYYKNQGLDKRASWCFAGAGLAYWATLMDGVACYKPDVPNQPGKATLYSLLLPGLGQAYNGEFWKVPIYWGSLMGGVHFWTTNQKNYKRYRDIYRKASDPEIAYDGPVKAETALYYRNVFRRYRDYSILLTAAFYVLQIIDANVFAYMQDFEVSDDISIQLEPTIVAPDNTFAATSGSMSSGPGFRIGITF